MQSWRPRVDARDREPGEQQVLVRCGTCQRVLAELWARPRSSRWGGIVMTYPGWGGEDAGPWDEHGLSLHLRDRFVCHDRCGREYTVRSEKLIVACLDALDRPEKRQRVIVLPDDVEGELDTAGSVSEWRFRETA